MNLKIFKNSAIALFKFLLRPNRQIIWLEFPVKGEERYSFKKNKGNIHIKTILDSKIDSIKVFNASLTFYSNELEWVSKEFIDDALPYWNNGTLSALDAISLYTIVREYKPETIIEIGSGNSTKFMNQGIQVNFTKDNLKSKFVSIDPAPRAEIDKFCDELYRIPLEDFDLNYFSELNEGDFIFFDGSHRVFQNNDVSVFFNEIIPRLKKGVLIGIHDIWLPFDYPSQWTSRFYSEQIILATYILSRNSDLNILAANMYSCSSSLLSNDIFNLLDSLDIKRSWDSFDGGLFLFEK